MSKNVKCKPKEVYYGYTYPCGNNFSFATDNAIRSKFSNPIVKKPHHAFTACPCLNACQCNFGHVEKKFKHEHPMHKLKMVRVTVEYIEIVNLKKFLNETVV